MNPNNHNESVVLRQILRDLASSFVSANGVSLKIAYEIGGQLIETSTIALDLRLGMVAVKSEDDILGLVMSDIYPKGEYVARLVANRILRSFQQINSLGATRFLGQLRSANDIEASSLLLPLYGVGPKFVENYCLLAGIKLP